MSESASDHRDSSPPSDWPRVPQFGLKSLFLLTTIMAVLCAVASLGGYGTFLAVVAGVGVLSCFVTYWTVGMRLPALFVLLCILPLLASIVFALMLPASAEHRNRDSCENRLHQLGIGLLNYVDKHGALPPVVVSDSDGQAIHSWRTLILPEVEEQTLYSRFTLDEAWNNQGNFQLSQTPLTVFQCPDERGIGPYDTSYVAVIGPGTAWRRDRGVKLSEITDGAANTILLVEMPKSGIKWAKPQDLDLNDLPQGITQQNLLQSLACHHSGFNAVFADAHVEFIPSTIPWQDFMALLTIAGGETVDRSKW